MRQCNIEARMKAYDDVTRRTLMRRTPVIIRVDGRGFHTFTEDFVRPFDKVFRETMALTMLEMCKRMQNCVFAYTQSDEISFVLCDWESVDTEPWFGNKERKLVSVTASMATAYFNNIFSEQVSKVEDSKPYLDHDTWTIKLGMFDSRAFNIPVEDVTNYFIWRQQDAERNSLQDVARMYYSHEELAKVSKAQLQNKLFTEQGVNWNDTPTMYKRGACAYMKEVSGKNNKGEEAVTKQWELDLEMPIITRNRGYVGSLLPSLGNNN